MGILAATAPAAAQERIVVSYRAATLPAPRVSVTPVGPALLRVIVAIDSIDGGGWFQVRIVARAGGDSSRAGGGLERRRLADTALVAAQPGLRYRVTAKVDGQPVVPDGTWSAPIDVDMPAAPTHPPAAAFALGARSTTPFAVTLAWQARSANAYGYMIEWRAPDSARFTRVGLVDPGETSWTHHDRRPGERATYRVIAFNAAGEAPPSATVSIQTARGVAGRAVLQEAHADTITPCVARARAAELGDESSEPPLVVRDVPFGRHTVDMRIELCGNANCSVKLYATYAGCYRAVADLFFVPGRTREHPGWKVLGVDAAGWPAIGMSSHGSAWTGGLEIAQMYRGRYRTVDMVAYCGYVSGWAIELTPVADVVLAKLRPPFERCQLY